MAQRRILKYMFYNVPQLLHVMSTMSKINKKAILLCCHKLRHPDGAEMLKVTVWIQSIYILKLQVVLDSVVEDFLH